MNTFLIPNNDPQDANACSILVYTENGTPMHVDPKTAREFGLKEGDRIATEQTRRAIIETSIRNLTSAH